MGVLTPTEELKTLESIVNSSQIVVIDFTATWCGPCRVISPIFDKLSEQDAHSAVKFYKVDVDTWSDISQAAGVRAMPTFMLFNSGEKVNEVVGAMPSELENLIKTGASLVKE